MNAVITGATKGIGRAISILLAEKGFNLAICSRNSEDLERFKTELLKINPALIILGKKCDVSNKKDLNSFAEYIKNRWDSIDILVNNAGVFFPGEILEEEEGKLEKMIETNLYSAYYLTRALKNTLLYNDKAHIFNMCSIASQIAYPNGGSYSISKFALLGFSKVLREELKEKNIKVTSILPGATWSNSWAGVDLPEERLMKSEDIADALWGAYRLSDSAVVEEIIIRPQLGDL